MEIPALQTGKVFDTLTEKAKDHRINILQGGTSSGKTYSVLQLLYYIAVKSNIPLIISIVSETFPHLKRGAMRDFFNIIAPFYNPNNHNKSDHLYAAGNSTIEFFSCDNERKVRGARRDILFINECNNVTKDRYDQMEVRTKKRVFLDFNPVSEFWAHELINDDNTSFFISTYKDNEFLDPEIIAAIEARKGKDKNWWRVYGEGKIGQLEGLIFPEFELIDRMPDMPVIHGLDFGYTNDPTAMVSVSVSGSTIYVDELLYRTAMTNQDIGRFMKAGGFKQTDIIYADSAEPKSIEEIHRFGYNIKPSIKGKDSINLGIDYMKRYRLCVTKRSTNLIKELRNYQWDTDKDGKCINRPIDYWNHCIDAIRYAISNKIKPQGAVVPVKMKI